MIDIGLNFKSKTNNLSVTSTSYLSNKGILIGINGSVGSVYAYDTKNNYEKIYSKSIHSSIGISLNGKSRIRSNEKDNYLLFFNDVFVFIIKPINYTEVDVIYFPQIIESISIADMENMKFTGCTSPCFHGKFLLSFLL